MHFLLVINSILVLSPAVFEIRPFIAWNFPLKIAVKPLQMETSLLLTICKKSSAPYPKVLSLTLYDLPFSHNTARLVYHSALW